jgi:hypothetical protein
MAAVIVCGALAGATGFERLGGLRNPVLVIGSSLYRETSCLGSLVVNANAFWNLVKEERDPLPYAEYVVPSHRHLGRFPSAICLPEKIGHLSIVDSDRDAFGLPEHNHRLVGGDLLGSHTEPFSPVLASGKTKSTAQSVRVTGVCHLNPILRPFCVDPKFNAQTDKLGANLIARDFVCLFGRLNGGERSARALLGLDSSLLGEYRSSYGSGERESADDSASYAENPRSLRRTLRRIGSLPLGAQVGSSAIVALVAWFIMLRGFVRVIERHGNRLKGALYLCVGIIGWCALPILWWASTN